MMDDDQLMYELRRVLDLADDGGQSRELAYAAIGWRDVDAELAELMFDSALDSAETVLRSAEDSVRMLTFSTARVTIEVEESGGQVIGQVVPPGPTVVELVDPSGSVLVTTETDSLGVFTLDEVSPGPTALVCRAQDGAWSVRAVWTTA